MKRKRPENETESEEEEEESPFPVDLLPDGPLSVVLLYAACGKDSLRLVLRSVCKLWNRVASPGAKYSSSNFGTGERFRRIPGCRGAGSNRDFGLEPKLPTLKHMVAPLALLLDAAEVGLPDLCELARKWRGEKPFAKKSIGAALFVAARFGHMDVCSHIKGWVEVGPKRALSLAHGVEMCKGAALGGHVDVCQAAADWTQPLAWTVRRKANDARKRRSLLKAMSLPALVSGSVGGHPDVCDMAMRWGPVTADERLLALETSMHGFAAGGHEELFRELHARLGRGLRARLAVLPPWTRSGWAHRYLELAIATAETGPEGICRIIVEPNPHISNAIQNVHVANSMMTAAARKGHENICRLAKEHGASVYEIMRDEASENGHDELAALAEEWIESWKRF